MWHDAYKQVTQLAENMLLEESFKDLCCWVIIEAASTRQCYVAQDGNKAQGVRRRQREGGSKNGSGNAQDAASVQKYHNYFTSKFVCCDCYPCFDF